MKAKILNLLLILTSLIGYLEWGKDASVFFFQAEAQILSKLFTDTQSVLHPLILLPLAGQLLLLITLFQKNKRTHTHRMTKFRSSLTTARQRVTIIRMIRGWTEN